MGNWKSEVAQFLVDHNELVKEITESSVGVMLELEQYLNEIELLKGTVVSGEEPKDYTNPIWTINVGDFSVELDLEKIRKARTVEDENGYPKFDSSIKVEDAIKDIISREFTSRSR